MTLSISKGIIALAALLSLICESQNAEAAQGECLLQVDGTRYIHGRCRYTLFPDGGFDVGGGRRGTPYAIVNVDPDDGSATASWNGPERASHAHWNLGVVVRKGGCWFNKRARICAWRPGSRLRR